MVPQQKFLILRIWLYFCVHPSQIFLDPILGSLMFARRRIRNSKLKERNPERATRAASGLGCCMSQTPWSHFLPIIVMGAVVLPRAANVRAVFAWNYTTDLLPKSIGNLSSGSRPDWKKHGTYSVFDFRRARIWADRQSPSFALFYINHH
jgi:hypothetical protein